MGSFNLSKISTRAPEHLKKEEGKQELKAIIEELNELQNLLYAGRKHAVLVIYRVWTPVEKMELSEMFSAA
ncbi:hypothetical protein KRR40_22440 [Niabella defluvii]|nr:hypothetical protein KRR40_22440 [Niabella sp. I65]